MRPAAVAGATLALAALLGACAGDDGEVAEPAPEPSPPSAALGLHDLEVGDCFNGLDRNQDLRVRAVPCARPHEAEVYGVVGLRGRRFPGAEVLRREAATGCAVQFQAYTGDVPGPALDVAFVEAVPSLASWSAGDRRGLCIALVPDGGRVRGSLAQAAA